MVGMNLCSFCLCMITSICDILKVTMTGLFHLACALAMNASFESFLVLLIELFYSEIKELRSVRGFYTYKEGLPQHMMIKGLFLQLPLEAI
ncbi:hypothetical protein SLEP1_g57944 [Rubroshorea leprosula]|uniref:Uncharacterized protein n=1 Tax=Rubroshorea leprosula TaxID=152421 RepID=A0AAV5MRR8_9ROSI|nr:hypothetical protein SLEP1_g57944 [Rubroshorea leprosula]